MGLTADWQTIGTRQFLLVFQLANEKAASG
jgi:hypothetical protein